MGAKPLTVWRKASRTWRWLPAYVKQQALRRIPRGPVHLIVSLADHFEPSIVPHQSEARAPYQEQERRVDSWCREYPRVAADYRDHEGYPFVHTYFYPAEQYDKRLLERLAEHCRAGWGEVEIHLHHGIGAPDTTENTRAQLAAFRDALAFEHGCLSYWNAEGMPRYAFVHGNYALANSRRGYFCGVDNELEVLAETGCYADLTLPPGPYNAAHIAKINCLYECALPLHTRAAHRRGKDLVRGRVPTVYPLIIEGPLLLDLARRGSLARLGIENGHLATLNPPTLRRFQLWKRAGISVGGRPDWLFIKLQCHGMNPGDREAMVGELMRCFLRELVETARSRNEILHFVSAREMVNIILAACDGRDGNPGDYRDYRLRRPKPVTGVKPAALRAEMSSKA
ncbi:MAG: hypothetical protein JO249_20340 [Acidobacteria bacterium]|nr:hypothetical protein [Acidobacteriota bacterium]